MRKHTGRIGRKIAKRRGSTTAAKKRTPKVSAKVTGTEQDLLWHMQNGYQLETDSLSDLVLRKLKDDDVSRPLSANRNTIKSMEERGLISQGKSDDPLKIVACE